MKILKLTITVVLISFIYSGCVYNFIVPEHTPDIPDDQTISFATQIAPIFVSANCVSCHKTGGTAPDLSGSNVYSVIVPNLVNTANPESSIIYDYPAPTTNKHNWKKYSATQAAYVLAWIQQGAQNN